MPMFWIKITTNLVTIIIINKYYISINVDYY